VFPKLKVDFVGRPRPVEIEVLFSNLVTAFCEPKEVPADVSGFDEKPYPGGTPSEGPLGNSSLVT